MVNRRRTELTIYRIFDWLAAGFAWLLFFRYRQKIEFPGIEFNQILSNHRLHLGLLIIPLFWIFIYSIFDKYSDIYRYSRLATLRRTFLLSLIGSLFLFFTILLDDETFKYTSYLYPFLTLFSLHFFITSFSRLVLLSWTKMRLAQGKVTYNTLLVGSHERSHRLYRELRAEHNNSTYNFIGYLSDKRHEKNESYIDELHYLGGLDGLEKLIETKQVEDVIIALDSTSKSLSNLLENLYEFRDKVLVKIVPDMYDVLLGKVKMSHVHGAALIEIDQELMTKPERLIKRLIDIFAALGLLIFCLPLYVFLAVKVRLSSKGPLLFKQERIGKNGVPFNILKFRSMYIDAEKDGPQLSSDSDSRITPFGKIMRKWRLDEIPQFYNLLVGDMSLVGPRPERQFYIDKISKIEPLYKRLLKVRPGITSWGQVKYGYASNIDQMTQRLKFDLIYLENMSISLDFKILFYTALILVQGKGK